MKYRKRMKLYSWVLITGRGISGGRRARYAKFLGVTERSTVPGPNFARAYERKNHMIKTEVLKRAAMCVIFFAMTVVCGACSENKPVAVGGDGGHPLTSGKGRKCPSGTTPQRYRIEVVASQNVFKDPTDADIAVCGGDKISWFINSPTGVIKIVFTDSYADQLFENGPTSLQSHPGSTTSDIDEQKVKPHAATTVYKYNIQVQDGSNKGEMDPHVIPMGN